MYALIFATLCKEKEGSIMVHEILYLEKKEGSVMVRPDHGPPDPINPTQPARKKIRPDPTQKSDGAGTGRNFGPETQKNPIQPENYT